MLLGFHDVLMEVFEVMGVAQDHGDLGSTTWEAQYPHSSSARVGRPGNQQFAMKAKAYVVRWFTRFLTLWLSSLRPPNYDNDVCCFSLTK